MTHKGLIVIISSPSGTGKTTVVKKLIQLRPNYRTAISYTTRPKRPKEVDGKDYIFVNEEIFFRMKTNNLFAEFAKVFDYFYATPVEELKKINQGDVILLDINWEGARSISTLFPKDVLRFFLLPPSMKELKNRLIKRARDPLEVIRKRLQYVQEEITHYKEYDDVLVNDDLQRVVDYIMAVISFKYKTLNKNKNIQRVVTQLIQESF